MENKLLKEMIGLAEKIEKDKIGLLRQFFNKIGGSYDMGDLIVINSKKFPVFSGKIMSKQIKFSEDLPDNMPALLIRT